jgi:hypothetical protein
MTENPWHATVWRQIGAAIDMLANAIEACPDEVWGDRSLRPEFWYVAFHTIFMLDVHLSGAVEGFQPPAPYTLSELDPTGVMPDRVYTRGELMEYLRHCRARCRDVVLGMTDEQAAEILTFPWVTLSRAEMLLYNMRHVQHHTAQLNLLLRQQIDSAPGYVKQAREQPPFDKLPA